MEWVLREYGALQPRFRETVRSDLHEPEIVSCASELVSNSVFRACQMAEVPTKSKVIEVDFILRGHKRNIDGYLAAIVGTRMNQNF